MDLKMKADLLLSIQGYSPKKRRKRENGLDIIARDKEADEKILVRVVDTLDSRRGIDVATADNMIAKKDKEDCDRGVFISGKFTPAAKRKLAEEGIKTLSEGQMPGIDVEKLYAATRKLVDKLCTAKCGKVPRREADCPGFSDDGYSCEIRRISDNASFHLDRMWMSLLMKDTQRLFMLQHSLSD
jgi:hypothetical protein